MRRRIPICLAVLAALAAAPAAAQAAPDTQQATIFLVRHAETAPDGTRNPPLSPQGQERARRLAELLADAGIDAVYSTDYLRTRRTAGSVAERLTLPVSVYDPDDLTGFAAELRAHSGRVLVVGHSNTTPALVAALGGDPGAPIDEEEHDRLYVLFLADDGVGTVILRY